jgi:predicted MPP superfamily phosphohydrolase
MLYVSRGSGTWGPPIRVLAPPEVTIIDIVPEKTS